jgi:hypothetical protein
MHAEKKSSTITTKTIASGGSGKGETIGEERASLVKASSPPSYLQRRSVSAEEEEKKKELMRKQTETNKNTLLRTKH